MAVVIPYVPQTWTDSASDCSAARNTVHEDGIRDAHYQPCVRVFHNAAQNIPNNAFTNLAFNSERIDQAGNAASTMHDNATNNSRLTCRHAGVYLVSCMAEWGGTQGANAQIRFRLNNTTTIAASAVLADWRIMQLTSIYPLAVNDFVEVQVFQLSGAGLNINSTANYSPEFMMHRVG